MRRNLFRQSHSFLLDIPHALGTCRRVDRESLVLPPTSFPQAGSLIQNASLERFPVEYFSLWRETFSTLAPFAALPKFPQFSCRHVAQQSSVFIQYRRWHSVHRWTARTKHPLLVSSRKTSSWCNFYILRRTLYHSFWCHIDNLVQLREYLIPKVWVDQTF